MDFPRKLFLENAKYENHSAEYLKNTLDYIDVLSQKHLPVIFSLKHLSIILGIEFDDIKKIIRNRNHHYSYFLIKKRNGGFRRIVAPHQPIRDIQKWIKVNILDNVEPSIHATGFVKKKSILDNAKVHENSNVILNIDLVNFFETITEKRIYGIFKSFGYCNNLAVELAKLCTVNIPKKLYDELSDEGKDSFRDFLQLCDPVLAQGASTSPSISNLICRRLDLRFSKLANKQGVNYSRYADDITFSGDENQIPKISLIKRIISEEGFKINWSKVGRFKQGQRQLVTGLLIDNKTRIPKKFKKDIYRHLHFCKKFGAYTHFHRINPGKGYKKEWLLGKIYFVKSIEPEESKKMFEIANQINWEI